MSSPPPSSAERYVLKDLPRSSHRILARWVRELPPGARVLELGPGAGLIARLARRPDQRWVGLEGSLSCLGALRREMDTLAIVDLESLPRLPAGADAVLAGDVLEHLAEPEAMLAKIRDCLRPGGTLLVSVPNVANLHVRVNLLFGRFPYADRGILDRTHRRFYTARSLAEALVAAGFAVERRTVSAIPLPLALPRLPRRVTAAAGAALAAATPFAPGLLGYQVLALARRR